MFLSVIFPGFYLALDHRGRLGGLGARLRMLVRNLRTLMVVYGLMFARVLVLAGSPR